MTSLRVVSSESHDCFNQMALDEALFLMAQEFRSNQPIVRFYQFKEPCVTIGFSQRSRALLQSIDVKNLPWVRRPTGGGVVFHNGDLIYSLVFPVSVHKDFHSAPMTYRLIHESMQSALKIMGFNIMFYDKIENHQKLPDSLICFENPAHDDLIMNGQKIAGGAERRSKGFLLHQGALQLNETDAHHFFQKTWLDELKKKFNWSSELSAFQESELEVAAELADLKYRTQEWNWKGKADFEKHRCVKLR